MKKLITAALAAVTLGGSIAAAAQPASAEPRGGHFGYAGRGYDGGDYRGGYRVGWGPGVALGAVALGAAVAGAYAAPPPAYYVGPGYYGYYAGCRHDWRWDPYAGRYVLVRDCY